MRPSLVEEPAAAELECGGLLFSARRMPQPPCQCATSGEPHLAAVMLIRGASQQNQHGGCHRVKHGRATSATRRGSHTARSPAFARASCSRRTAMICCSVKRFRFICPSFNRGRTLTPGGGKTQWQVTWSPRVIAVQRELFCRTLASEISTSFVLQKQSGSFFCQLACMTGRPLRRARTV